MRRSEFRFEFQNFESTLRWEGAGSSQKSVDSSDVKVWSKSHEVREPYESRLFVAGSRRWVRWQVADRLLLETTIALVLLSGPLEHRGSRYKMQTFGRVGTIKF